MEISTSQSPAVAAYAAQQQTVGRERETADAKQAAEGRRGDDVSFSSEALRLSGQDQQDPRETVERAARAGEAAERQRQQQQVAANPEFGRADAANTVAQAINAYHATSII